jgi:two-component system, NarL family, invasion response regulator UvrY
VVRILIADDHAIVRHGLIQILAGALPGLMTGEAANAVEALSAVREQDWDLVILDMGLPGRNGLETLGDIRKLRPLLPVLFLSIHPEEQYATRVLKAGGNGYLTKDSAPSQLVEAVCKVIKGGRYISPTLAESLAQRFSVDAKDSLSDALSNRELEVLRMLGAGKSVTQIAAHLGLSVKTVSTYRSRIMIKLGRDSTAALIRYALEHRLTD